MNRSTLNALRGNPEFPAFAGRVPYSGLTTALLLVLLSTSSTTLPTWARYYCCCGGHSCGRPGQGHHQLPPGLRLDQLVHYYASLLLAGGAPIASILAIKNQPGLKQEGMIVAEDCLWWNPVQLQRYQRFYKVRPSTKLLGRVYQDMFHLMQLRAILPESGSDRRAEGVGLVTRL